MTSRQIKIGLILVNLLAAAVLIAILAAVGTAPPPRVSGSEPTVGGPFELVGAGGKTVRDSDFHGRHLMVFFGYTHCPDICPTALVTIADAFERLTPEESEKVRAIFVSVDPARDTPDVLAEFTSAFHDNISGLTGSREQIDEMVKAYKAVYRIGKSDDPEFYPVDHSSIIYLMDRDGKFIKHFSHRTEVDKMVAALKDELKKP